MMDIRDLRRTRPQVSTRPGPAAADGRGPVRRRPAATNFGFVAAGTLAVVAIVGLPLLRAGTDFRAAMGPALVLMAAALATASAVAALPAILIPRLQRGHRDAVMPAMLIGAGAGVAAVLLLPEAVGATFPATRSPLLTYATAAAAAVGLAQVLALHRLARVGGRGVALVTTVALAVGAAEALLPAAPTLDDGVVGLIAAAIVLLAGLGTATSAGGPTVRSAHPAGTRPALDEPPVADEGRPGAEARRPPAVTPTPGVIGLVAGAAVVGLIVRLVVGPSGGANDAAVARLVGGSFSDAVRGTIGSAHPPLSVVLVWVSRQLFGDSALALRLPSLVAGMALVPVAFATGRVLYGRHTAAVAAIVAAVGPAFVWVSAGAGPAAVTALCVCLALLAMVSALRHGRAVHWLLFGVAGAAVVWAHQFGLASVAVLHVATGTALVRRQRRARTTGDGGVGAAASGWAAALGLTGAAVATLVGWRHGIGAASTHATLEYATNAAPAGGSTPFGLAAAGLSTIAGFHPPDVTSRLLALWPLGILAAFALLGRRWSPRGVLLVALAAAPFVALLVADLAGAPRRPPLALEWLAPALPGVALAAGRAVSRLTAGRAVSRLTARRAVAGVVAVLALATADQSLRVMRPAAQPAPAGPSAPLPAPTATISGR